MRKILLITEQFPPLVGGASIYFYNLYSRLPSEELIIYTKKRKDAQGFDVQQKIKIIRRWIWKTSFSPLHPTSIIGPVWLFFSIIKLVFKEKIDIIHCGSVHPFGECGLLIKKLLKIPYIVYTFGEEIGYFQRNRLKRFIITTILKNADAVISMSENTKEMLRKLGIDQGKITKIPGGIDLEKFKIEKDTNYKEKFNLQDEKILLTVARLEERKGHDVVIEALPKVLERFPEVVYAIVGTGSKKIELKTLVKQLKLENNVIFFGEISHFDERLIKFYNMCDIFIMINRQIIEKGDFEGFGLVFLEAAACGKPVIGGKSGGAIDAVEDGLTGILINNPLDENEVADAILRLLSNEEEVKKMGETGRKRVEEFFSWEKHADKIIQINKKVLADIANL